MKTTNPQDDNIPSYPNLLIPTLKAIKLLGGSGTIEEINNQVYVVIKIDKKSIEKPHSKNGLESEIDYRLAWARTYLKKYGLLENSRRGIWSLIDNKIKIEKIDSKEIVKKVRDENKKLVLKSKSNNIDQSLSDEIDARILWKETLLKTLKEIHPSAFERLCQRLLRESGFTQVEITGQTGDGGIDGKGIVKINGFLSFSFIFQCKRYNGSVGAPVIRDFRGAMSGRADKGLVITTGTFTKEAIREASREGVTLVELIDGETLCERLKELNLGVNTELIEEIKINEEWFNKI